MQLKKIKAQFHLLQKLIHNVHVKICDGEGHCGIIPNFVRKHESDTTSKSATMSSKYSRLVVEYAATNLHKFVGHMDNLIYTSWYIFLIHCSGWEARIFKRVSKNNLRM